MFPRLSYQLNIHLVGLMLLIESVAICISIISVIIAMLSLYYSNKQFKQQTKPVVSCRIILVGNNLFIILTNAGRSPATNLQVTIESIIENNVDVYDSTYDCISEKIFDLYPEETVSECIWFYAGSPGIVSNCTVSMKIQYYDHDSLVAYRRTLIPEKQWC